MPTLRLNTTYSSKLWICILRWKSLKMMVSMITVMRIYGLAWGPGCRFWPVNYLWVWRLSIHTVAASVDDVKDVKEVNGQHCAWCRIYDLSVLILFSIHNSPSGWLFSIFGIGYHHRHDLRSTCPVCLPSRLLLFLSGNGMLRAAIGGHVPACLDVPTSIFVMTLV